MSSFELTRSMGVLPMRESTESTTGGSAREGEGVDAVAEGAATGGAGWLVSGAVFVVAVVGAAVAATEAMTAPFAPAEAPSDTSAEHVGMAVGIAARAGEGEGEDGRDA